MESSVVTLTAAAAALLRDLPLAVMLLEQWWYKAVNLLWHDMTCTSYPPKGVAQAIMLRLRRWSVVGCSSGFMPTAVPISEAEIIMM